MSRLSNRIRRVFETRYGIAVVLLALAATASFATSIFLGRMESHRAEAVAEVAEQRALSQRIAFLVSALEADPARRSLFDELMLSVERMEAAHDELTLRGGDSDLRDFLEPIQGVYFAGYLPFDSEVLRFLESARTIAALEPDTDAWAAAKPLRDSVIAAGTDSMLQTHGLMIRIMQVEAERAAAHRRTVDHILYAAILVLLLLVTLGLFRPMSRMIASSFADMEEAEARAKLAAEEAAMANAAKGRFFRSASHELKTPLNAILGFTDVLEAQIEGEAQVDALDQMRLAGEHLASLVDLILDTHRADEGTLRLEDTEFLLHEPLAAAARIAEGLAARKGIVFESMLDVSQTAKARGDATRLRQVCLNLLDTALRTAEAGPVRFAVAVEDEDEDPARLAVSVSASSPKIAQEQLSAATGDVSAEQQLLADAGSGLGLSLALSRYLVDLMDGEMTLAGDEADAAIRLRLPLDLVRPAVPALPSGSGEAPLKVLIVDDNMPNRMVAEALVGLAGAETVLCADGKEAVAAAAESPFDVILMDISMPVMDGIAATQAIRRGGGLNASTPIIAVTAHVSRQEVEEVLAKGLDAVIHKPINKGVIEEVLLRWTGDPQARQDVGERSCA
ncbi:response regulator [Parvularcula oceani]|uniref:response regulator n=1 Tax=Parvularcula oceani TaxID=1247963 RepID=UPI0004E1F9D7|nr:response regulator [Parvularcula oceani]